MKYRKLDENGDYAFGLGNKNFIQDSPETVAQAVLTRLRLWYGEWFMDQTDGTPYQQGVLGKNNQAKADGVIRERILRTENHLGVRVATAITEFSSSVDPDLRVYRVSATIDTIYGQAQINEVL